MRPRLDEIPVGQKVDFERIAAGFDLGEQAFRKKFRRLTEAMHAQYRSRRLIEQACLILEQNNETCRSIAHRLGFEGEFHCPQRFKQLVGRSPPDHRQRAATISIQERE